MSFYTNFELTYFDNDGEAGDQDTGDQSSGDQSSGDQGAGDQGTQPKSGKTFTQEDVNRITGQRNKALKEKYQALESTYTELLEQTNLTEGARERLEADLEAVQKEMRTKEQQIEFEKKKAQTKFESELKTANEKGDYYQKLFETSTAERAIIDAANANDGCNAEDFIAHLGPKTKIIDELDNEGRKTGRLVPRIEWEVKDEKTGEVTRVQKTPDEVVKIMQEMPDRWGHLFRSNVAVGVGEGTAKALVSNPGKINISKLTTEEYMELAKTPEGRRSLGIRN